jgi:excinuclease ABC subunit A
VTQETHIVVKGAQEHNLQNVDVAIPRNKITVITGVSGSGKSSLAFDTILVEAQRRFFYTLSHYSRQFLDLASRPALRSITGLSPAISLRQNETMPSKRATVGSLTEIGELFGVLFSNYGVQHCPKHGHETTRRKVEDIGDAVIKGFLGQTLAICAPVAREKKGSFTKQLHDFAEKGYVRAVIDAKVCTLTPPPKLNKDEKHTIQIVVDLVKVKEGGIDRLVRSISTAVEAGEGYCEVIPASDLERFDLQRSATFSILGGCPQCGFSWPRLDPRYFSNNSLGRCAACAGLGVIELEGDPTELDCPCEGCSGTGFSRDYSGILLGGKSHIDVSQMNAAEISSFLTGPALSELERNPAFCRVRDELDGILTRIAGIGLGYLAPSRRILSLSGGEAQRLRLANILQDSLRGVIYILDEPSQGLHPIEVEQVLNSLCRIRDMGNTIVMVDHDDTFIRSADEIVDLGPGGGAKGGKIIAQFVPDAVDDFVDVSRTAWHLARKQQRPGIEAGNQAPGRGAIVIRGPLHNNLKIGEVSFRIGALNVVSGVSGAGKSSLALGVLYPNLAKWIRDGKSAFNPMRCKGIQGLDAIDAVELIDRRPIARSSVSMPVTYLDLLTEIRSIYEKLPDSQVAGLTGKSFSLFSAGGRCDECEGRGQLVITMKFLADARVVCPVCRGRRYKELVRGIRYLGLSIDEVLDLSLEEAAAHFKNHKRIVQRLEPALGLGLGYLRLGQPTGSLSGGEAQRLKIVPYLTKSRSQGTVLIFEEPTCGLHFEDVDNLLKIFNKLTNDGITLIVIEHNFQIIAASQWLVDLGPGAGNSGGNLVYEGQPGGLLDKHQSQTARFLCGRAELGAGRK